MQITKTEEIIENDLTYIVNTYDNGTIEKYLKPDPNYVPPEPEPRPKPVTNEEIKELLLANMQGTVDLYTEQAENKQLQLDTMQGIADLYALQLTNQGGV